MSFSSQPVSFSKASRSATVVHSIPASSEPQWTPVKVKTSNGDVLDRNAWEFGSVGKIEGTNCAELRLKIDAEAIDPKLVTVLQPGTQLFVKVRFGNDEAADLTVTVVG